MRPWSHTGWERPSSWKIRLVPTSTLPPSNVIPSTGPTPLHYQAGTIENTAYLVRKSWTDVLDRIKALPYSNGEQNEADKRAIVDLGAFWTGVVHTLQVGVHIKITILHG